MSECRVCFTNNSRDFLISPCLCRGSVKYIHSKCLEHWLKEKYKTGPDWLLKRCSDGYTGLHCELCHYEYRGRLRLLSVAKILQKIGDSQSTLTIVLNILVIFYSIYKMTSIKIAIKKAFVLILNNWKTLGKLEKLKIFPHLLRFFAVMISAGVYLTSLPIMVYSTWQVTKALISDCCVLEIESYSN